MSNHVRIECEHPSDPAGDVLEIKDWLSYQVESDMWTAADGFTMRLTPTREYMDFFRIPGHSVRIYYKDALIMTGIIEATPSNTGAHGPQIELTGRDLACLLVDDSAEFIDLTDQSLAMILEKLVAPHSDDIPQIITDYSAHRKAILGKRPDYRKVQALRKEKVSRENAKQQKKSIQDAARRAQAQARRTSKPLYAPYTLDKKFKSYVKPGELIWGVIDRLCKHIGVTAWMTQDGKLCVGRPDYDQEPLGTLFVECDQEGRISDSNCLMIRSPDVGNRYSDYLCLGQGRVKAGATGKELSEYSATARDPSKAFWYDELMRRRKRTKVLKVENSSNKKQLTRYARTIMEEAIIRSYNMTATVEGHEVWPDGPLWAVDTVADVEYGPKAINAPHYIRRREFVYDVGNGMSTNLTPIPCGIWLATDHDSVSDSAYWKTMRDLCDRYAL